ncbi:Lrp/AsnC family transcriptional regulator [Sedimenticola selenatireducens]|uniref:Lrp/AsnC family transcriptional regulator n=1 Tax=Sedimenticola selenatireducens TaxID=191960 RepID=UPI0004B548BB|nr:Lrp/AsnC family transcriptional regulator [Sedimenticola selenatireducens]
MHDKALDTADLRILAHLQSHAKASNHELAEVAFLSPSQCHRRVKRLEELNIIRGYTTQIDPQALGLEITIFVNVSLDAHGPNPAQRFSDAIKNVPEVIECFSLTGETDYLIKARLPNLKAMSEFLMHRLMSVPGVGSIKTSVVVEEIECAPGLINATLSDSRS